ncbi:hypothetical protein KFK09_028570 [Dendrobium nobile]|uniref:Reverse transcriptase Ty1/copia-type domain-containing protein n=1 Tax=Dendrobium nobile TaxID=94219 RepID=A0A8T3A3G1_DENNO|nr:hypothetical protein KFK09_028570 [Dendrobium nobile]
MRQPPGYEDPHQPNHVCKLKKSLYGLKQAPRLWFQNSQASYNHAASSLVVLTPLLIFTKSHIRIYILIYVDDILITGNDSSIIQTLLKDLNAAFSLKQLGMISLFLGIQVLKIETGFFLTQEHYANKLINEAGFDNCKACSTPIAPASAHSSDNALAFHDPSFYCRLAGSLQYLSITRPDIAFATNRTCQHMQRPTIQDFQSIKRILRYVKGTLHFGLPITPDDQQLRTYTNADWASNYSDRKSVSDFCTFLGPNLISWSVKKQATVVKSSTEAEYKALFAATSEILWLRRLASELQIEQTKPTVIHCDNVSVIAIAKNLVFHARTKHIEIDYHFIRQHISSGAIQIQHISSQDQIADILTKPFSSTRFNFLRSKLTIQTPND